MHPSASLAVSSDPLQATWKDEQIARVPSRSAVQALLMCKLSLGAPWGATEHQAMMTLQQQQLHQRIPCQRSLESWLLYHPMLHLT